MRRMLRALGQKLGLLHPSGTLTVSYPDENRDGPFSIGGPSYHITDKGVEGPIYPVGWGNLAWAPRAAQLGGDDVRVPPEEKAAGPDDPEDGKGQAGTM